MNISEIQTWVDERIDTLIATDTGVANLAAIIGELIVKLKVPPDWSGATEAREVLYEGYRTIVGVVNRKRKKQEESHDADRQLVLPTFTRLQRSYSIQRDGQDVIVAIEKMTRTEALAKRNQLAVMRDGLTAHVKDWDTYIAKTWASPEVRIYNGSKK
jgi:hypothetical protein